MHFLNTTRNIGVGSVMLLAISCTTTKAQQVVPAEDYDRNISTNNVQEPRIPVSRVDLTSDPISQFISEAAELFSNKENRDQGRVYRALVPVVQGDRDIFMIATVSGEDVKTFLEDDNLGTLQDASTTLENVIEELASLQSLEGVGALMGAGRMKPKCYGTNAPPDRSYDAASDYKVVGITVENGALIRHRLTQFYLDDNGNQKTTKLYKEIKDRHIVEPSTEEARYEEVRRLLSRASKDDFSVEYIGPNGVPDRTPYYNQVDANGKHHLVIHYVVLDPNLRFQESAPFEIHTPSSTKLYAPYWGEKVHWKGGRKRKGRAATIEFSNHNINIGGPKPNKPEENRPAIETDEVCLYPYDFLLTSTKIIRDPMTGQRSYTLKTPIIVDPRNGSKGPPPY